MMAEQRDTVLGCNLVTKMHKADVSHLVKLSVLGNMVRWLTANNDFLLKKEYEDVEDGLQFSRHEAQKPHNRAKNRYSNCITYDHSRVKLQFTGEDGSDYINASWIMGEGRKQAYIASQAPLRRTVCDMWRMVWEHRVEVIVMITTLTEGGTEKCVKYWPESVSECLCVESSRLGVGLKVTLKISETHSHWQHRVITVEEMEDSLMPPLTVHHYHFTDWPDHSGPSSPTPLLHLLHHIHTTHTSHPDHNSDVTQHHLPPLLVHCSAGVGRTGTLIAVDRLLQQMKAGAHSVNVLQTVRELRMCRPGMVQNVHQYKFIYLCLAHVSKRQQS